MPGNYEHDDIAFTLDCQKLVEELSKLDSPLGDLMKEIEVDLSE